MSRQMSILSFSSSNGSGAGEGAHIGESGPRSTALSVSSPFSKVPVYDVLDETTQGFMRRSQASDSWDLLSTSSLGLYYWLTWPPGDDDGDDETEETIVQFDIRLANIFKQMMYVSGETAEPSVETTGIIEDIVRQQVIELASQVNLDLATPHI